MKVFLILVASVSAFSVSAATLECKADLSKSDDLDTKLVKTDTRSIELDKNGNGELGGIIVDAYEKFGISYNYAVYVKGGNIVSISAENEVALSSSGISKLKGQTEVEFSANNQEDQSSLEINCKVIR